MAERSPFDLGSFGRRHIGIDASARERMLDEVGFASVDALMESTLPGAVRASAELAGASNIPEAATEREAIDELRALAAGNTVRRSMIGLGYYDTITPAVIQRQVLENPSWYTAYTPYQPEISQGRLEALINFQTMVAELTGLDIANASMLDEGTAVVEGMLLARRASRSKSSVFLVDADALPQTRALLAHRAEAVGIELREVSYADDAALEAALDGGVFGALVQYPGASGLVSDPSAAIEAVHGAGGLVVMAADLLALTLLKSPGELGADIAVGTTQRFGVPLGFGGPHAGYMAISQKQARQLPGRLVGVSQDAAGRPAYRLSLQAREQHIRREKATSNICTAQVLLAVMAAMYAVYHGPDGLRDIAENVHRSAVELAESLEAMGFEIVHGAFFDTVQVRLPARAADVARKARDRGYLLREVDGDTVSIAVDETTTEADIAALIGDDVFGAFADAPADHRRGGGAARLPEALRRESEYLTDPVFHRYRSETAMLRYLARLAGKDYALDRGMIPLGSCTMKLNAATEMAAVTWPEFGSVHPFAPREDVPGYLDLIAQLELWLAEVTGYDTVSLQPNAGSQGELAGLLAIRGYHRSRGDDQRTVCIIPQSAHGTNAASAVLAGLRVVVVATDDLGNVDLDDLHEKIEQHRDEIAALMITYPSTHGVYEQSVADVCKAVHDAGGQVYIDGANLNAMLGFGRFGEFGGDVSHLNLHKTFCIPHGGGGPGVGPVAARAHLAPFLPSHPMIQNRMHPTASGDIEHGGGPVSAAPYGSPSILPISWAYVRMMGTEGLRAATAHAVLSANYIAKRLGEHFPVLYRGESGLVAHECILDVRPLTAATGVTVDDIAKRLIDYGFHAPTMSFPVAGTLMVEPTESEDIGEIDRFIDAMIAIKGEAEKIAAGEWDAEDNPLVNAPHVAADLLSDDWQHAYSRDIAAYPASSIGDIEPDERLARVQAKYWPPVSRIDQAFGDRNLVCSCPPPEAFA